MRSEGRPPARSKCRPLNLEGLEPRLLLSAPVIQSVEDQPDLIEQDDLLTLTARSVTDPDGGSIAGLSFYRSADAVFDGAPTDPLIGAATQIGVTDEWGWSDDGEGAAGVGGNLRFEDSVVAKGAWDSGEGISPRPNVRTGAVDEVFVTGRIGEGDTTGGWIILRPAARGFWLAGPSVGDWTTNEERVYFGDVYGWDVCF